MLRLRFFGFDEIEHAGSRLGGFGLCDGDAVGVDRGGSCGVCVAQLVRRRDKIDAAGDHRRGGGVTEGVRMDVRQIMRL